MESYGQEMKYHRELNKISQQVLAEKTGIKQSNISRWESGKVMPTIDFCVKLADFYGISVDELIGREGYIPSKK